MIPSLHWLQICEGTITAKWHTGFRGSHIMQRIRMLHGFMFCKSLHCSAPWSRLWIWKYALKIKELPGLALLKLAWQQFRPATYWKHSVHKMRNSRNPFWNNNGNAFHFLDCKKKLLPNAYRVLFKKKKKEVMEHGGKHASFPNCFETLHIFWTMYNFKNRRAEQRKNTEKQSQNEMLLELFFHWLALQFSKHYESKSMCVKIE